MVMKQKIILSIIVFLAFSTNTKASLFVRGTDTLGNQLIYDDVQKVTWYDYSFTGVNLYTFPSNFTTQFGSITLNDWRLPKHLNTPITCWAYGLNDCSATDELGYLWKDELGNPFGDLPSYGLTYNKGTFINLFLEKGWYWLEGAWYINSYAKDHGHVSSASVFLVRDGDVVAQGSTRTLSVPEPLTAELLVLGMALMGLKRKKSMKCDFFHHICNKKRA